VVGITIFSRELGFTSSALRPIVGGRQICAVDTVEVALHWHNPANGGFSE